MISESARQKHTKNDYLAPLYTGVHVSTISGEGGNKVWLYHALLS